MARTQLVEIDLSDVRNSETLHSLLMESLGFPTWYGRNWDAFWDAITGLVEMPLKLNFIGWDGFSDRLPDDASTMRERFVQMQMEFPQFAAEVFYA